MQTHGTPTDPYRIFFPLGVAFGVIGVSIWPLYYFGITKGYSGRAHAFVQTDAFLFAFIAGFLLTAIPRFTGTEAPSRRTQFALAAIVALDAIAFEFQFFSVGTALFLASYFMLMTLAVRRFLRRQQQPPETFPFVGLGLVAGLLGAVIEAGIAWNVVAPSFDLLGKRLVTEGMVLLLVLGIGGFLGPRLLGFAELPQFTGISVRKSNSQKVIFCQIAGLALVFSLIAEYGFSFAEMAFLRAAIVSIAVLTSVRPWHRPVLRTTVAWCVWTAHWLVIVSLWISAIIPRYRIDVLHILFIGGFSLLIFGVATRVTLSHTGHSLALERRSWPLRIGLTTGLVAMLARVGAPFAALTYFEHLAYAGLLWIAGLLVWGFYIVRWTSNCQIRSGP